MNVRKVEVVFNVAVLCVKNGVFGLVLGEGQGKVRAKTFRVIGRSWGNTVLETKVDLGITAGSLPPASG